MAEVPEAAIEAGVQAAFQRRARMTKASWDDFAPIRDAIAAAAPHIAAAERERIGQLAEEHEARYDLTKPCGCGRIRPRTGRPCTVLLKGGLPFADLIRSTT